jgi:phage terminase large subunit
MAFKLAKPPPRIDFDIELQPKELQLLAMMDGPSRLIGYGGARGGAKSHAARSVAVLRRLQYPGTSALIFRRTYPQLYEQHILPLMSEWPELFRLYWQADQKMLMLPGNSPVFFRYADTIKDILEFKGKEYGDEFIDEATDLEEQELKILYSCNRTTSRAPGFKPTKVLTFNPGGKGHGYVKRLFIDRQPTAEEAAQNPAFIQAYAWDNVMWVKAALEEDGVPVGEYYDWPTEEKIAYLIERSDYGRELNALPEALRKPWLYGDWDTFAGQMFDEWQRSIHVVRPFAIPDWWRRGLAVDTGFSNPAAWGWYAASPEGRLYKYREMTFRRTPYSEQAKAAREAMTTRHPDGSTTLEHLELCVTGRDSFTPDPETNKGPVDYYHEQGVGPFIEADTGAGSRSRGAGIVHEYLRPYPRPDGEPGKIATLAVFETCTETIRTLPTLVMDPKDPEAVLESDSDHWYDETRYYTQTWHSRRSQAPPEKMYKPGTAGDLLQHAQKSGAVRKDRGPFR